MKIAPDTNVLVRLVTADDASQTVAAASAIRKAEVVAVSLSSLCELAWVLRTSYSARGSDIATAIRLLTSIGNVACDRHAIEAGLSILDAGGDFADGVIAHEGRMLGGHTFVSFDKQAIKLLMAEGRRAELLR